MIKVNDYELIQDISCLYERPIIILGGGHLGKRIASLLKDISLNDIYVYDRNSDIVLDGIARYITQEQLINLVSKREYTVIIGSERYKEELLEEIRAYGIENHVYSWYGVQAAIELNLNNAGLPKEFSDMYSERRNITKNAQGSYSYFQSINKIYEYPEAILVWQSKKVGSKTICKTLDSIGIKNVHLHELMNTEDNDLEIIAIKEANAKFLKQYVRKRIQKIKIITLVREPIARAVSEYMQEFSQMVINLNIDKNVIKGCEEFVANKISSNYEFNWFDEEIKELTGVDVYSYPFNKKEGYGWIKEKNIEILILKLEMLNKNFNILGEFVGNRDLKLINDNIGEEKHYTYIYNEVKRGIRLPRTIVEKQYKDKKFLHFYSDNEAQKFMRYWQDFLCD